MVFSSIIFIFIFLPITLVAYFVAPKKFRNFVLLIASLIFYAWGEPVYIAVMLFSTVLDFFNGIIIERLRHDKRKAKLALIASIVVNLALLSFFKYYGFFINNINTIFGTNLKLLQVTLPVGISFYTFQSMSYVIDVYLGRFPANKNFISYAAYVSMFPQLVAGPIVRYKTVRKELESRKETFAKVSEGIELFIFGLAKKVLFANNIGMLWSSIKSTPTQHLSVLTAWIGIVAFTLQIYFDFSGYSDMARGLGKIMGFNIPKNFNYPYISKSATEFWRRWHITLGGWFREYVYIPLGGNRRGKLAQYRNLIIVWFLTGLWHGASWNFILWGLYYGLLIIIEKLVLLKLLKKVPAVVAHIYALIIIVCGWVLFEFDNLLKGIKYIGVMFSTGKNSFVNGDAIYYLYTNVFLLLVLILFSTPYPRKLLNFIKRRRWLATGIIIPAVYIVILFLCTACLVNETYNPFLYFRF